MKTLVVILLFVSLKANAQNHVDLVNIYWRTAPLNIPATDFAPKRKGILNTYVANVKIPIRLNEYNVFIGGLEYQHNTIQYTNLESYRFASSMLQLGLEHTWNDRSKMLFMTFGRLNTDYNTNVKSPLQIGGLALGTTAQSENFDWKYGMYYNSEFFGPMIVPLFGFNWKINNKWRLKLIAPIMLEVAYKPKDRIRTGLRFDGVNGSYRASKFSLSSYVNNDYLDKADNNIWAFAEFLLGKKIWIHFKAGHSVLRKYNFYSNTDKLTLKVGPVNIGNNRLETVKASGNNGLSFEMRFIYRFPLSSKKN